jgi:hypothetical protein
MPGGVTVFVMAISPGRSITTVPALRFARFTLPLTMLFMAINPAIKPTKIQAITLVSIVRLLC